MGSFQQKLRDLPFIGYFLRVVYAIWKLPEMWDVLTGAVPVARPARDKFNTDEERKATAGAPASVMDLTARVIDLTALVREQTIAWAQHQDRLYSSVPVYLGGERLLLRTEAGQLLICNAQDIQRTSELIDRRVWDPSLTAFYDRHIKPGMKYLEIGANVGYFTTLASNLVGNTGRVHAFEQDPTAFSLLKVNCELNHCRALIELSPLAVSDTVGPGTTLDESYRNRDIVFDFIKIDAHGAEPSIFAGAQEFLRCCTAESTIFAVQFKPQAIERFSHDAVRFVDGLLHSGFFVWQFSEKGDLRSISNPGEIDQRCHADLILSRDLDAVKGDGAISNVRLPFMYFALLSNIFPPHVRGGYELGCQSIARALVRLGHRVVVLTSASIGQLERAPHIKDLQVLTLFEPIFEYEDSLNDRFMGSPDWRRRRDEVFGGVVTSNALSLARFLAASRPDVLWIFNPLGLGPIGILEAALTQPLKCVIHLMDDVDGLIAEHQRFIFLEGRYRRLKSSISAISCSRKILYNNECAGSYRSHRVIYNGVDFDEVPCHRETGLRPEQPCRFVYFGQVSEAKGLLHILRAASHAKAGSFILDIIGRCDPTFETALDREIATLGLRDVVNVLGFVPREAVLSQLTDYDAAILLLSSSEPFGFAPLEAAAAGLPVILTDGVGIAECFPKDYSLLIQDRNNAADVASKMDWCILNSDRLRPLGLRLRDALKVHCDFDSVVMPAYLRTMEACPVGEGKFCVEGLLSSYATSKFYNQVRLAGRS